MSSSSPGRSRSQLLDCVALAVLTTFRPYGSALARPETRSGPRDRSGHHSPNRHLFDYPEGGKTGGTRPAPSHAPPTSPTAKDFTTTASNNNTPNTRSLNLRSILDLIEAVPILAAEVDDRTGEAGPDAERPAAESARRHDPHTQRSAPQSLPPPRRVDRGASARSRGGGDLRALPPRQTTMHTLDTRLGPRRRSGGYRHGGPRDASPLVA